MKLQKREDDCQVIFDNVNETFTNLGNCFDSMINERETKMSVVKGFFKFGGSLTKLAFNTTSCAIKKAPKAVVAVAVVKRDIINFVEEESREYQKQQKEDALNEKILALTSNSSKSRSRSRRSRDV